MADDRLTEEEIAEGLRLAEEIQRRESARMDAKSYRDKATRLLPRALREVERLREENARLTRERNEALTRLAHAEADAEQAVHITLFERDAARARLAEVERERDEMHYAREVYAKESGEFQRMHLDEKLRRKAAETRLAEVERERDEARAEVERLGEVLKKTSKQFVDAMAIEGSTAMKLAKVEARLADLRARLIARWCDGKQRRADFSRCEVCGKEWPSDEHAEVEQHDETCPWAALDKVRRP